MRIEIAMSQTEATAFGKRAAREAMWRRGDRKRICFTEEQLARLIAQEVHIATQQKAQTADIPTSLLNPQEREAARASWKRYDERPLRPVEHVEGGQFHQIIGPKGDWIRVFIPNK